MWEPSNSSSSSGSHNRGIVLLILVLSACVFLYKAWGPLLLITCALVVVVHTCYSLLVSDSLLAPHTLILLRYFREIAIEITQTIRVFSSLGYRRFRQLLEYLKQKYEERFTSRNPIEQSSEEIMNGLHKNVYRLSTMNSELDDDVSPINSDPYRLFAMNGGCDMARTSTPIARGLPWKKSVQQNGEIGLFPSVSVAKKLSHLRSENRPPGLTHARSEETLYSRGARWGNNAIPKIRERATGIKTVQTIAGPLLASTKYNIDPKIYADISSPGLTSRLTKYATEASNKLTHQAQYATGQFPKVNLNASPTPIINTKLARARMAPAVRIAPPEAINYSPSENHISQDRSKILLNASSEAKESKSCPSVAQVLKVMSLKRHATAEDKVMDMLAKKQRMERIEGQLENLEEMIQKRARDESITSEEDLSPQSKTQRPLKRPKASSCHDILNSLSSSVSVMSGIKRKAMDSSRCSTPEKEKHFKSSSVSPIKSTSLTFHSSDELSIAQEQVNVHVSNKNASGEPYSQKSSENEQSLEFLKTVKCTTQHQTDSPLNSSKQSICKETPNSSRSPKLTDKLFMRAEPCPNEKLKHLIVEQSSIEAKFTSDGNDQIKKQDIINMRQNNMRQRLQSMFDAISGKSDRKISPDVVIHAEEVTLPTSSVYSTSSSSTTTTTVNTSPISTTIVPILKTDSDQKSAATKHVTFNLPTSSSSLSTMSSSASLQSNKEVIIPGKEISDSSEKTNAQNPVSAPSVIFSSSSASSFTFNKSVPSSSTSNVPSTGSGFNFLTTPATNTTAANSNSSQTTTAESTRASVIVGSSGFSFGQSPKSITTSATTVSSAPSISLGTKSSESFGNNVAVPTFGNQASKNPSSTSSALPTVTKSNEISFGNSTSMQSFGNQSSKSPVNTSITPTMSTFGTSKEGSFSFGSNSTANNTSNTTTTKSQLAPIFGMASSKPMFSAGNATTSTVPATTAQAPTFSFGGASSKSTSGGFSFGATTTATTSTTGPVFGNSTSTAANSSSIAAPTFGAPVASNSSINAASTTTSPIFGSSSSSLFGGSATSPSILGGSSMFKTSTTIAAAPTTNTSFSSQTNPPAFGTATVPAVSAAVTTAPSPFGNISNVNSMTAGAVPSLFGNATGTNSPAATSSFFNSTQQQATQGNIFSGVNATTSASPSIFGSTTTTAAPSGLFSGTITNPSVPNLASATSPANSTNIFGQTKSQPTLSFGATSSAFGSTNPPASFSAPGNNANSTFSIGSVPSSSSLPSFNAIKTTPQFGTQTTNAPAASSTTSLFGSTSNAFGAPAASASGFGGAPAASTSAFGGAPAASTSGFGGAPAATASAFGGAPAATTSGFGGAPAATASGFGGAPAATASSFGGTAAAGSGFGMQGGATFGGASTSTTSPFSGQPTTTATSSIFGNAAPATSGVSFSFGGAPTAQTQQPQQPSATFSFGGAANSTAPAPGGLFQFGGGSNTASKPGGFNFSQPNAAPAINFTGSAAPPAFNAPATNMFSIGSGSSTPRSRTSRPRRQR